MRLIAVEEAFAPVEYIDAYLSIGLYEYVIENQHVRAGTAPNTVLERRWL